jgi:hypothetical protein
MFFLKSPSNKKTGEKMWTQDYQIHYLQNQQKNAELKIT